MNVFLWRIRRNMNSVSRLIYPIYGMNTYIFKVTVFTKQAKSERIRVWYSSFRVFPM